MAFNIKKNYYLPIDEDRTHRYVPKGTPVLAAEAFDQQLFVNIKVHLFALEVIFDRQAYSKEFDNWNGMATLFQTNLERSLFISSLI